MSAEPSWNPLKIQKPFRRRLLGWYSEHRRDLPWRRTGDPYRIWVSEIMLQQTRVAAVLEHYRKFLKAFPTVRHLANASEAEVLAQWSGLGYYRRARMLHAAAKLLVKDHQGRIPRSAAELRTLAGIGRYTSNAIASIAFGEPVAVVDGNVERVIHRLTCGEITGESVWDTAQNLLDPVRPGDFNQAMMELGATICVPGVPDCVRCPVKQHCQTHSSGASPRVAADKEVRIRQSASVLLAVRARGLALCQRKAADRVMPGMWELPSTTSAGKCEPLLVVKHSITRTDWTITVFRDGVLRRRTDGLVRWVPLDDVSRLPLTGLTRKILRRLSLLA